MIGTALPAAATIGIAGAGLLGRLMAWQLTSRGYRVELFDKDTRDGKLSAGIAAAAMLAPYSELLHADPVVFEMGRRALSIWPQWIEQLQAQSDMSIAFQQRGSIVVAHAQDGGDFQRFVQRLQAQSCVPREQVEILNQSQLKQVEPSLATRFQQAVYLKEEGAVANWQLFAALEKILCEVPWHQGVQVDSVQPCRIVTAHRTHEFDHVLDCRGFGARNELKNFRGVRGELIWVRAPEVSISRPVRLMHPRYQLYIAPKPDNVYVIGATEIESESMAPITVRSTLELMSALYSVDTAFAEAELITTFANCRPGFFDNLPRIQHGEGITRINGLYRHGYLLSPVLVGDAMSVLTGGELVWPGCVEALNEVFR
jgi:glycine oxidase